MTRHLHGISAFVSQTSFRGETVGGVAICRLFSQANKLTFIFGSVWAASFVGIGGFLIINPSVVRDFGCYQSLCRDHVWGSWAGSMQVIWRGFCGLLHV